MRHVHVNADRHGTLELPDGTLAASLRVEPLRQALQRAGIAGITAQMGKTQLLDCFASQIDRVEREGNE